MTPREFAVGVMWMLIVAMGILGILLAFERVFEPRHLRHYRALQRAKRTWAKSLEQK